jgi:hypothetical protein
MEEALSLTNTSLCLPAAIVALNPTFVRWMVSRPVSHEDGFVVTGHFRPVLGLSSTERERYSHSTNLATDTVFPWNLSSISAVERRRLLTPRLVKIGELQICQDCASM